ncbi:hypothetical protein PP935_gp089 [Rhizobium phage RHph_N34]|uniref:Uncharacterized protein n=1 Tax=Rhizobium phage RHph_N34 TaxID=2509586 RepID=A0A7S5RIW8_9CAUD|nr:hypothetical protein PP935_gp089 [Rhizobium phage RHph_N34]QIG73864.1 hypothetical protein EVC06_089 [Rhizobium phage RHph_N34]
MSKTVEFMKDALEELRVNKTCKFEKGYIKASEWKNSYAPKLREVFPKCWWTVNSDNYIVVYAE